MKKITIIMKVTNACNLHCKHCYEKGSQFTNSSIMSLSVLEDTIQKAQTTYKKVTYIWFGGEPLLAGLDFFQKAVALQRIYNNGVIVCNRIQTNGILLSDDFIKFFKLHNFNVSLSFDGLYNECLRQKTDIVQSKITRCQELGLNINILSTICSETCDKQIENYEYFKKLHLAIKFNPIFPAGAAKYNQKYLLDEVQYIKATKDFFKYWINDENAIPVSTFIQYAKMFLGYPDRNCVYGTCLYTIIDVEPEGDLLPCSRYSKTKYLIGNIFNLNDIEEAFTNESFNNIVIKSILRRNKCKSECEIYKYCLGGCSSACANESKLDDYNTQLCRITKELLPYVFNELEIIFANDTIRNPILEYLYTHK